MTDTISLTEWINANQGASVAVFCLLALSMLIWRDVLVTGKRHREMVTELARERDWWRTKAQEFEAELRADTLWRDRVVAAFNDLADILKHVMDDEQKSRWFKRWIP